MNAEKERKTETRTAPNEPTSSSSRLVYPDDPLRIPPRRPQGSRGRDPLILDPRGFGDPDLLPGHPGVTALDLNMIQKIKSLNKSYLLIRTKIDVECGLKNQKPSLTEDELFTKLRDDLVKQIGQLLCAEDIFLISNFDPYKWNFLD